MRLFLGCILICFPCAVLAADLEQPLAKLRQVGPKGLGHPEASAAWKEVAAAPATQLTTVLAAMDGAGPLSENWIRAAVEAIAQRERAQLPVKQLEAFLADTSHSPRGRRLAYELVASIDPQAEKRLIPGLIDDPSLELRRDAVAMTIAQGAKALEAGDKRQAIAFYRKAFDASRDLDQVKLTVEKLRSFGETVDVRGHYGFLPKWYVLGPFDNRNAKGFDVAYPPEEEPRGFVANASYDGSAGEVRWIETSTTDDYGIVDLNKAIGKHMGAIGYAFAEFDSAAEGTFDVRLGTANGNKLWINGEPVFANHVYHAGNQVDQYVGQAKLNRGRNTILLKIAQNEQTDSWAQDWSFQFRICDQVGTPVKQQ